MAIDAFVNADWIYYLDDDVRQRNGANVLKDFRASLRTVWIRQLSIEVPLLLGPLARDPIIPRDPMTREMFRELLKFFRKISGRSAWTDRQRFTDRLCGRFS